MIIHGDCHEEIAKMIASGEMFDHVIVDPPYNIGFSEWDSGFVFPINVIDLVKPNGNIIIFQGWSNVTKAIIALEPRLEIRNWIVWDRIKGRGSKSNFVSTREDILWFCKGDGYFNYKEAVSNTPKKTGGMGKKNGVSNRKLTNVWYDISPIVPWSSEYTGYPAQKPLQLMERIITLFTRPKDRILDFTMGSGTTCVAAKKLGRDFVGIDNEIKAVEIARKRLGI